MEGKYEEATASLHQLLQNYDFRSKQEEHSLKVRLGYLAAWNYADTLSEQMIYESGLLEESGIEPDSSARADKLLIAAIREYSEGKYASAADLLLGSVGIRPLDNKFDRAILATTYGFQGFIYQKLEDYETSVEYYQQAIRLDRQLGRDFVMALEMTELATTQMRLNPVDPIIDSSLSEAFKTFESTNNSLHVASVHTAYGNLYQARGKPQVSRYHFKRSIDIRDSIGNENNLDIAYNNLGAAFESLNMTDSSMFYYRKAIKEVEPRNKIKLADYFYNMGARYGRMSVPDSALHYFNLAIFQIVPHENNEFEVGKIKSVISPNLPVYLAGRATSLYREYLRTDSLDYLRSSLESYTGALDQLDTLRFLYSFDSKPQAVKTNRRYYALALQYASELYDKTNDPIDREKLFLLASRSKGLVFDEYLRINQARDFLDLSPELLNREDSLKMLKAAVLQQSIQLDADDKKESEILNRYSSLLFDIDESLRQLGMEIKENNPSYYNSIHSIPGYKSGSVMANLSEDELIIDYTWHGDKLIVICMSNRDFEVKRINTEKGLREDIGKYHSFLGGSTNLMSYNEFKQASHDLYKTFIEPFKDYLEGKTLFIIPDDSLVNLPFETLLFELPEEDRADYSRLPYLLVKNNISYFHSVQQFMLSRISKHPDISGLAAFAPFVERDYSEGDLRLNKLAGSGAEIKAISRFFPSRRYKSSKATEKRFREQLAKNKIIHAATHGLQSDSLSLENYLLFYPGSEEEDYKFHLFELLGMKVEAPLVVLSSCNSGTGTFQPGEGLLSLARAFHFAGAKSLVMSQWLIDDDAAANLMKNFYRELSSGTSLNRALQLAKLKYLEESDKPKASPYYWAGLQLTGYPDELLPDKTRENKILLAFGGIVLGLIIILLTVRLYLRRKIK